MRSALNFAPGFVLSLALCALLSASSAQAQNQYRVVQTTGAGIVTGDNFAEVATPSCADAQSPNNDCVGPVALPFDFNFYDQTFPANSIAYVSTNGNLQFSSSNNGYGFPVSVCFPLNPLNNVIAPFFTDIQTNGPGEGIYTSVSGSAPNRIFNIEWRASFDFSTPGSLNFQIRLYEGAGAVGQKFDIIYGTVSGSGASAPGDGTTLPAIGSQRGSTGSGAGRFTQVSSPCGGVIAGGVRPGLALSFVGTPDAPFIQGRVTDTELRPLAGVTVSLTTQSPAPAPTPPPTTASVVTGADGTYSFDNLNFSDQYTVSVADQSNSLYFPQQRSFSPDGSLGQPFNGPKIVNFVRTPAVQPRDMLVSEFRFRGPQAVQINDEFVELYNNTASTLVVNTADGSSGWLLLTPDNSYVLPNGTVIPARHHFLVSGGGYSSLYLYAPGDDFFFDNEIASDTGVALFKTVAVDPANAADALTKRIDAAGFSTVAPLYREGAGLPPIGNNPGEYSFVRRLNFGTPFDSDDNLANFVFVSTDGGAPNGVPSTLGAPGPENLSSPVQRNATVKSTYVDPTCTGQSSSPATACARVRAASDPGGGANGTNGVLLIRRRFTNRLSVPITQLRFRVVDITTRPAPGGTADLRLLDSTGRNVNLGTGGTAALRGLTVEDHLAGDVPPYGPSQPLGGGLNTSITVAAVTPGTPLAPNASVNIEFRLGVEQTGNFRFFINVEAAADEPLPAAPAAPAAAPSSVYKATRTAPATKRDGGK
jgi:hypothetical protein